MTDENQDEPEDLDAAIERLIRIYGVGCLRFFFPEETD